MIRVGDAWANEIVQPFRGQGYFKFFWFPEFDPSLKEYSGFHKRTLQDYINSSGTSDDPFSGPEEVPVYNGYTLGNRTIEVGENRWVLDGSRHTALYNNQYSLEEDGTKLDEDMIIGIAHLKSNSTAATDDPRCFIMLDNSGYSTYVEFQSIYPQSVNTNKIWILWDVANEAGPYKFDIEISFADGTSETRNIVNSHYLYMSCIDLGSRKKVYSIYLKVYSWTFPSTPARISQIGFGELITSDSEEVSVTSVNIEKSVSLTNNENSTYRCDIVFDNTSNYFNPLDPDNIANRIKVGSPFYNIWEMDTVEHDRLRTDIESWRIISTETLTDSKEFKLILGFEGDLLGGDYFPTIGVWDRIPLMQWFMDALTSGRKSSELSQAYYPYTEEEYINNISVATEGYADIGTVQDALRYIAQASNMYISKGRMGASIHISSATDTKRTIPEICVLNHPKITFGDDISGISINVYKIDRTNFTSRVNLTVQSSQENSDLIVPYGTWSSPDSSGKNNSFNIVGDAGPLHAANVGGNIKASSGRQALVSIHRVDKEDAEAYFDVYTGLESFKTILKPVKSSGVENIVTIDNKFITSGDLYNACTSYLKKLLVSGKQVEVSTTGIPELEPGDIVIINTELGKFRVAITKTTLEFNGGFSGTILGKILEEVS